MAITAKKQLEYLKNRDPVKYMVFDLEVQNHFYKGRVASKFCDDNWIVMAGWKRFDDKICQYSHHPEPEKVWMHIPEDINLLVGHNIKFDLLWQWDNPELHAFFKRGGRIWCTQTAEYLIGGMAEEVQLTSMDQIIEKYGGRKKIDAVKELWNQGVLTADIDPQLLKDYLIGTEEEGFLSGDIGNTERIFKGQWKLARIQNQIPMIEMRMRGLSACCEAEWNGLHIDMNLAEELRLEYQEKLNKAKEDLAVFVKNIPEAVQFNWNSNDHMSYLLYGGHIPYDVREHKKDETGKLLYAQKKEPKPILDEEGNLTYYKSGKKVGEIRTRQEDVDDHTRPKMHTVTYYHRLNRMVRPDESWVMKKKDKETGKKHPKKNEHGEKLYKSNSDILDEIYESTDIPFIEAYMDYNGLKKDLSTYYYIEEEKDGELIKKGMLTLVGTDEILHGELSWTKTITSRLSSQNPNLQNLPNAKKSAIRKVFTSRFEDGWMSEIDYSQLEVVVLGVLTKDKQLTQDLLDGIDFHCVRVAMKYTKEYPGGYDQVRAIIKDENHILHPVTSDRRTACKILSFQKQYGAGPKTIAKTVGMPVEEVLEILNLEDLRYDGVVAFNTQVKKMVEEGQYWDKIWYRNSIRPTSKLRSNWVAPTGTIYTFEGQDAPDWMKKKGIKLSFSPPNMKNYPIQGTGGEMVQAALGAVFYKLVELGYWSGGEYQDAFLCNTVHDCVWFDFRNLEIAEKLIPIISKELESIPEMFNSTFDMGIKVKFPVEAELGRTMHKLEHLDHIKEKIAKGEKV